MRVESQKFAEIGALVVSSTVRGKGCGKLLLKCSEEWAKENGYFKIRVRSRTFREDAHRLYLNNSFSEIKEQKVFEKYL